MPRPFPYAWVRWTAVLGWLLSTTLALSQPSVDPTKVPHDSYWSETWRGWHFYEPPEPDEPSEHLVSPPTPSRPSKTPTPKPRAQAVPQVPELAQFERLQKAVESYRNIAIMRPTETNVRRYMELEAKVVARASYFADVAQHIAWSTPELDPTLQGRPVNAKALEVFDRDRMTARSHSIAALGENHVLFFFFRSDCPYCHAFAPTLAAFEQRHGIKVVAISMDGGLMPGFADTRVDNGIGTSLKVSQVPAVYLAQPFTGQITPIGFGVLSEAELVERITTVSTPAARAMLPSVNRQIELR